MHSEGVFVEIQHSRFGSAKGSGVQINNIVITHGSILASLCITDQGDVIERYNSIFKELQPFQCNKNSKIKQLKFKIFHRNNICINDSENCVNCKSSSVRTKHFVVEEASLLTLHDYTGMFDITKEIANWTMDSNIYDENHQLINLVFPKFIFLSVDKSSSGVFRNVLHTIHNRLKDDLLYPGLPLIIESTPFSNYSFFNSWSRGIVSKMIGSVNDGIITDARLVTGCEGGPIFV